MSSQAMIFSRDPDADIAFVRDMFGIAAAPAGGGWLVLTLPSGQSGMDEFGGDETHQLYLECRDLDQGIAALAARGVAAGAVDADWGRWISVALPGGGRVRLHERA